jgi:hypothetical protein
VQKSAHRIFGRTRATVLGAVLLSGAVLSGAALPALGLLSGSASAAPLACDTSNQIFKCEASPTHIRPAIYFNILQTFTVTGTLYSFRGPVSGQHLFFSTGRISLCRPAITNSHGVASCVLSYAASVAIRQNSGRYTVSFPGSDDYLPSSATGQAIIHP